MNRLIAITLAAALLPCLPSADAGGCHPVATVRAGYEWWPGGYWQGSYYAAGYYPVAKAKVVETRYVVTYSETEAKLLAIVEKLVDQRPADPQTLQLKSAPDGRAVLRSRCYSCHGSAEVAAESGTRLVMPENLTADHLERYQARINSTDPAKRMPPGKPLPAAEKAAVLGLRADTAKSSPPPPVE